MGAGKTDNFRKSAVGIALTSGLSRRWVSDDLSIGFSRLNKGVTSQRDRAVMSTEDRELALENERLGRENSIPKDLQGSGKSLGDCFSDEGHPILRKPKAVKFRFIEEQRVAFSLDQLCRVMNISPRGLGAFRDRPASRRQHMDSVVLRISRSGRA